MTIRTSKIRTYARYRDISRRSLYMDRQCQAVYAMVVVEPTLVRFRHGAARSEATISGRQLRVAQLYGPLKACRCITRRNTVAARRENASAVVPTPRGSFLSSAETLANALFILISRTRGLSPLLSSISLSPISLQSIAQYTGSNLIENIRTRHTRDSTEYINFRTSELRF